MVPAFDATLGTLVRVDVRASAPVSGFFGVENLDVGQSCSGGTWSQRSGLQLEFLRGGFDVLNSDIVVTGNFGPLSAFDGMLDYSGASGQTSNFSTTLQTDSCFDDAAVLAAFEGAPGSVLTFEGHAVAVASSTIANCMNLVFIRNLSVGIGVEVTYTYCPSAGATYCSGDGGGTPCPCGNSGAAGSGCANGSFASGASLRGSGNASVAADSLALAVSGSTPSQPGLFFQGNNAVNGGAGTVFGDGLRCAGGGVARLQVRTANASGNAASTVAIAASGGVSAGDVKRYQWWYRDPNASPCGAGFNLSNGLQVSWAP